MISYYHITYQTASPSTMQHVNVSELWVNITGLTSSTNYSVSIAAVNDGSEVGPAYSFTVQTLDALSTDAVTTGDVLSTDAGTTGDASSTDAETTGGATSPDITERPGWCKYGYKT